MAVSEHCETLNQLEGLLGDPFHEEQPLSYKQAMECDEQDAVPRKALEFLQAAGVMRYLVPKSLGGELHSYQHLYYVIRQLSRRDVSLATLYVLRAIGLGPVLIRGSTEQKAHYAQQVLQGCGISWGVSEREHGSDLLNSGSRAEKCSAEGYILNGSKWLIGGASTAEMLMFLARSGSHPAPDSFTLFCVDSRQQTPQSLRRLPREKLYGVRGLDLSGFELSDAQVETSAVIGEEGGGLELMLQTAQMHRVGAVTMAVGAMDAGLRIAMSFANTRHIFDKKLVDIPITRMELAQTYSEILLCEVVISSATRALHYFPKLMFLQAAIAKVIVPSLTSDSFHRMARAIGARYFLRETFAYGLFQKAMRDAEMTSFVDGNEKVNLKNIALHMEVTLTYLARQLPLSDNELQTVSEFYNLNQMEPEARFSELAVFSGKKDLGFLLFEHSAAKLKRKLTSMRVTQELFDCIDLYVNTVAKEIKNLQREFNSQKQQLKQDFNYSPESYQLAQVYALLHCAADCVHMAVYTDFESPINELTWLPLCLYSILKRIDNKIICIHQRWVHQTFDIVQAQFSQARVFSLLPLRVYETPDAFCDPKFMNI